MKNLPGIQALPTGVDGITIVGNVLAATPQVQQGSRNIVSHQQFSTNQVGTGESVLLDLDSSKSETVRNSVTLNTKSLALSPRLTEGSPHVTFLTPVTAASGPTERDSAQPAAGNITSLEQDAAQTLIRINPLLRHDPNKS